MVETVPTLPHRVFGMMCGVFNIIFFSVLLIKSVFFMFVTFPLNYSFEDNVETLCMQIVLFIISSFAITVQIMCVCAFTTVPKYKLPHFFQFLMVYTLQILTNIGTICLYRVPIFSIDVLVTPKIVFYFVIFTLVCEVLCLISFIAFAFLNKMSH